MSEIELARITAKLDHARGAYCSDPRSAWWLDIPWPRYDALQTCVE